jgi:hypothetical protein
VSDTHRYPITIVISGRPLLCTSLLQEVVDRECVGAFQCQSVRAAGIYFQACPLNHSDISPFRINTLQRRSGDEEDNCDKSSNLVKFVADDA